MTDQNSQFFAMLTAVGEAKQANADALGIAWKITHMSVGDANGTEPIPNRLQTTLLNERRRAPLNQLKVDPNNTSILIAEQVIPEDVGGFWIREVGLHDEAGDLVAIANCAPSYKPQLSQGSGRTQVVRMNFIVSSAANVELKIDPSVVLATRKYVDDELAKLDHKQSVRYATTAAIALAGLAVQAGGDWAGALTAGDRVLVKNQAAGKDNGLYAAAAGAWPRVADADGSPEVTPGLVVAVEQGTTLADTRWQLVTDGVIVLGTTSLVFQNVTQGFAPLASPALTGNPTAPTAAQFDNDSSIATTEFVQRALGSMRGIGVILNGQSISAAHIGKILQPDEGAAFTFPKPSAIGVVSGASFVVAMVSRNAATMQAGAGSGFYLDIASADSISLGGGQCLRLTAWGDYWLVEGHLKSDRSFGALLGASGYQKLPSGLIIQWGTTSHTGDGINWTYPIAFPNAVLSVFANMKTDNGCATAQVLGVASASGSSMLSGVNTAGTHSYNWLAVGY